MMKFLFVFALLMAAWPVYALDTCNAAKYGLCTLPCGTITSTPVQVLPINSFRTEILVANTGSTTIYVILGRGNAAYDYTYGIPVAPQGQSGAILDLQIQPDPTKNLHTWTSTVSVVTQSGTGTCVYAEKAN